MPLTLNCNLIIQDVLEGNSHNNPFVDPLQWAQRQADRSVILTRRGLQAVGREMTQLAVLHGGPQGVLGGLVGLRGKGAGCLHNQAKQDQSQQPQP